MGYVKLENMLEASHFGQDRGPVGGYLIEAVQTMLQLLYRRMRLKQYYYRPLDFALQTNDILYGEYGGNFTLEEEISWIRTTFETLLKSYGYAPSMALIEDAVTQTEIIQFLQSELDGLWYKIETKGTRSLYEFYYKLQAWAFSLAPFFYVSGRQRIMYQALTNFDNLQAFLTANGGSYSKVFDGYDCYDAQEVVALKSTWDAGGTFDELGSLAKFDWAADMRATASLACLQRLDRVHIRDGVSALIWPTQLLYIQQSLEYAKKATHVVRCGVELNITLPINSLIFEHTISDIAAKVCFTLAGITGNPFPQVTVLFSSDDDSAGPPDEEQNADNTPVYVADGDYVPVVSRKTLLERANRIALGVGSKSMYSPLYSEVLRNLILYLSGDAGEVRDTSFAAVDVTTTGTMAYVQDGVSGDAFSMPDGNVSAELSSTVGNSEWSGALWVRPTGVATSSLVTHEKLNIDLEESTAFSSVEGTMPQQEFLADVTSFATYSFPAFLEGTLALQNNLGNMTSLTMSAGAQQLANSLVGGSLKFLDRYEGAKSATITANTMGSTPILTFDAMRASYVSAGSLCHIEFPTLGVVGTLIAQDTLPAISSFDNITYGQSQPSLSLVGATLNFTEKFGDADVELNYDDANASSTGEHTISTYYTEVVEENALAGCRIFGNYTDGTADGLPYDFIIVSNTAGGGTEYIDVTVSDSIPEYDLPSLDGAEATIQTTTKLTPVKITNNGAGLTPVISFTSRAGSVVAANSQSYISFPVKAGTLPARDTIGDVETYGNNTYPGSQPAGSLVGGSLYYTDKYLGLQYTGAISISTEGVTPVVTFPPKAGGVIEAASENYIRFPTKTGQHLLLQNALLAVSSYNNITFAAEQPANSLIGGLLHYTDKYSVLIDHVAITGNDNSATPTISFTSRPGSIIETNSAAYIEFPERSGNVTYDNHTDTSSIVFPLDCYVTEDMWVGSVLYWTDDKYDQQSATITANTAGQHTTTITWTTALPLLRAVADTSASIGGTPGYTMTSHYQVGGLETTLRIFPPHAVIANQLIGWHFTYLENSDNPMDLVITGNTAGTDINITFAEIYLDAATNQPAELRAPGYYILYARQAEVSFSGLTYYTPGGSGEEQDISAVTVILPPHRPVTQDQFYGWHIHFSDFHNGAMDLVITGNSPGTNPFITFAAFHIDSEGGPTSQYGHCLVDDYDANALLYDYTAATSLPFSLSSPGIASNEWANRVLTFTDAAYGQKTITITSNTSGTAPVLSFAATPLSSASSTAYAVNRTTLQKSSVAARPSSWPTTDSVSVTVSPAVAAGELVNRTLSYTDLEVGAKTLTILGNTVAGNGGTSVLTVAATTMGWITETTDYTIARDDLHGVAAAITIPSPDSLTINTPVSVVSGELVGRTIAYIDSRIGDTSSAVITANTVTSNGQSTLTIVPTPMGIISANEVYLLTRANLNSSSVAVRPTSWPLTTHLHLTVAAPVVENAWAGQTASYWDSGKGATQTAVITSHTAGAGVIVLTIPSKELGWIEAAANLSLSRGDLSGTLALYTPTAGQTTTLNALVSPAVATNQLAGARLRYTDTGKGEAMTAIVLSNTSGTTPVLTVESVSIGWITAATPFSTIPLAEALTGVPFEYTDTYRGTQTVTLTGNTLAAAPVVTFAPRGDSYIAHGASCKLVMPVTGSTIDVVGTMALHVPTPGESLEFTVTLAAPVAQNSFVTGTLNYTDAGDINNPRSLVIRSNSGGTTPVIRCVSATPVMWISTDTPCTILTPVGLPMVAVSFAVGGVACDISVNLLLNVWASIYWEVLTTDGVSVANIYIDNELLTTSTEVTLGSPTSPTMLLWDGFEGDVDELRLWSAPLSAAARTWLFENHIGSLLQMDEPVYISPELTDDERYTINSTVGTAYAEFVNDWAPGLTVNTEVLVPVEGSLFTTLKYAPLKPKGLKVDVLEGEGGTTTVVMKDDGLGRLLPVYDEDEVRPPYSGVVNYATGEIVILPYFDRTTVRTSLAYLANLATANTFPKAVTVASDPWEITIEHTDDNPKLLDDESILFATTCKLYIQVTATTWQTYEYDSGESTEFTEIKFKRATGETGNPAIDVTSSTLSVALGESTLHLVFADTYTVYDLQLSFTSRRETDASLVEDCPCVYQTNQPDFSITEAALLDAEGLVTLYATFPPIKLHSPNNILRVNFCANGDTLLIE